MHLKWADMAHWGAEAYVRGRSRAGFGAITAELGERLC